MIPLQHQHNIQNLLPYFSEIHTWAHNKNLQINPTKTTTTLMTPDPSEYNKPLNIHINNTLIPTISNPTILGLTFDLKLKISTHTDNTITKANKTLNLLKLLTSTHWGKSKKTHIATYKTSLFLIIEHANTICSPIISFTSINKLQKNSKRSLENNHRLHPRHQHPTPLFRNQNSPTPKSPQTSRMTTHTNSLSSLSSPTPTHHTRSSLQIQKTIHIQQQYQLHPKHTLLHPDHLSQTNKKQHENNTHKNSS